MSQIVAKDFFSQGGVDVASSPLVLKNMGKYENLVLVATSVTKVEGSPDGGTTFFDITGLGSTFTGGLALKGVAFGAYRITYTGTLFVNAN